MLPLITPGRRGKASLFIPVHSNWWKSTCFFFSDPQSSFTHDSLIRSPLKKRNVSNKPKSNQAKSKGAPSSPEPKAPRTSLAASLLARIRAREGLRDPSSHEDIQDGPISVTPNLDTAGGNDGDDNNDGGFSISTMGRHVTNEALVLWQSLFQRDLEKQPPVDRVMFRTASRHDKVCLWSSPFCHNFSVYWRVYLVSSALPRCPSRSCSSFIGPPFRVSRMYAN